MTTIHTLASGSSGNALLLSWDGGRVLVDAGISCRRIRCALQSLGISLRELDGVLITHTHSDHVNGLQTLLKNTDAPVWATAPAGRKLCCLLPGLENRLRQVPLDRPFSIRDCTVTAFPTSHDAPGSCGYRFDTADGGAGVLTDSGIVTREAEAVLPGVSLMILEANHDVETLKSGPYPESLKQRILGPMGHLSNEASARFAAALARAGANEILLAHLSAENNTPAMARNAVERVLLAAGLSPALSVLPRSETGTYTLSRRKTAAERPVMASRL